MHDLTAHITVSAEPARIWKAFTTPTALSAWFWPDPATVAQIDLRDGGRYRLASARLGIGVSGEFQHLDEPEQLSLTWKWDNESEVTAVTVTIDGSTVTVDHRGFAAESSKKNHVHGWHDCLSRLPGWLSAPSTH